MGWASWNSFFSNIDHNVIKQRADALVSSGMAAAGYKYVESTTAGGKAEATRKATSSWTRPCGPAV